MDYRIAKYAKVFASLMYEQPQDRASFYRPESRQIPDSLLKQILRKKLCNFLGFEIWVVNGSVIRDKLDMEFALGGNPARYQYVPENQIWIENIPDITEVAIHELTETIFMLTGLSYDKAHEKASQIEEFFRKEMLNP